MLNCLCPTIGGSGFKLFRQSECVKQRAFSLEAEERWWCRSIPHIRDYLKGLGFLTNATPGEPQFLHNCPFSANRWSGNIWSDEHVYCCRNYSFISNQMKCKVGIVVIGILMPPPLQQVHLTQPCEIVGLFCARVILKAFRDNILGWMGFLPHPICIMRLAMVCHKSCYITFLISLSFETKHSLSISIVRVWCNQQVHPRDIERPSLNNTSKTLLLVHRY